jgi:serine/threonine-protein kinase
MSVVSADPQVGTVVDGKYQIVERLGTGGMGTVYKAMHLSLGAPRALKMMRPELAGDVGLAARFRTEARLAESLRHPYLVALYDFGQLPGGAWYIVSEFVEGATLALLLRRRGTRFGSLDVARLMGQVADGLALAHRKGVIHRDISPDNIMLTSDEGEGVIAKLLDFGIAKDTVRPSPALTGVGWNIGKIGFSSPEQMGLLGKDEAIDARCDVFSLAAVAYLMLSGVLPWRRDGTQSYMYDLLLRPEAELMAEVGLRVPVPWREVFVEALARGREARIGNMTLLRERMAEAARRTVEAGAGEPPSFRADMLRSSGRVVEGSPLATQSFAAEAPAAATPAGAPASPPSPSPMAPSVSSSPTPPGSGPIVTPSAAFREDLSRLETNAAGAPEAASGGSDGRHHVVLLDDDEAIRRMLPELLESPDLTTDTAPWRGDPAAFAAACGADLILLDVDPSEASATERLRCLRREPRLQRVPVVLFSSADEWTLRALVRRTGANGYLGKGALGTDIGAAVRRLLPKPTRRDN